MYIYICIQTIHIYMHIYTNVFSRHRLCSSMVIYAILLRGNFNMNLLLLGGAEHFQAGRKLYLIEIFVV